MSPAQTRPEPSGHWDGVYTRLRDTEVSWYEASPKSSLDLLDAAGATPEMAVGGGCDAAVHLGGAAPTDVTYSAHRATQPGAGQVDQHGQQQKRGDGGDGAAVVEQGQLGL